MHYTETDTQDLLKLLEERSGFSQHAIQRLYERLREKAEAIPVHGFDARDLAISLVQRMVDVSVVFFWRILENSARTHSFVKLFEEYITTIPKGTDVFEAADYLLRMIMLDRTFKRLG